MKDVLTEEFGHPIGNNLRLELISDEKKQLKLALGICLSFVPGCSAECYAVYDNKLVYYWREPSDHVDAVKLPFKMQLDQLLSFTEGWLSNAEYGSEPDHDGDNERGFRVSTGDFWGHVDGSFYSICSIEPMWIMVGK